MPVPVRSAIHTLLYMLPSVCISGRGDCIRAPPMALCSQRAGGAGGGGAGGGGGTGPQPSAQRRVSAILYHPSLPVSSAIHMRCVLHRAEG